MAKRLFWIYLILSFLLNLSFSFFFATYVIFLMSRGMDLLEINLINSFFMVSIFIMEIPTGAIADNFGRRISIASGCFILSVSFLIYFFSNSFWGFVLAETIGAVSLALLSGSIEAWIVDSLKFYGYDGGFKNIFRRSFQAKQIGIIVGSLIGAYVGEINIAYPWLLSSICNFFMGFLCLIILKEVYFEKKERIGIKKIIKESIAYGWKRPSIKYMILFSTVLFFSLQALNMQWQIVFKDIFNLKVSCLGWLFFGTSISILAGNQITIAFSKLLKKEKDAIVATQLITTAGILAASTMIGLVPVMTGFLIHEVGRGMFQPLQMDYLNHRIPSDKRATIISFDSMITKIGAYLGLIVSGAIAKYYSISLAWLVSGIVIAISLPIFLKMKNGE